LARTLLKNRRDFTNFPLVWKDARGYAGVVEVQMRWKEIIAADLEKMDVDGINSLCLVT
jgi:hypothetical protein